MIMRRPGRHRIRPRAHPRQRQRHGAKLHRTTSRYAMHFQRHLRVVAIHRRDALRDFGGETIELSPEVRDRAMRPEKRVTLLQRRSSTMGIVMSTSVARRVAPPSSPTAAMIQSAHSSTAPSARAGDLRSQTGGAVRSSSTTRTESGPFEVMRRLMLAASSFVVASLPQRC